MKIARAMKERARLQGEIKEIKKRLSSCLSTVAENEFSESFKDLMKLLHTKTEALMKLKIGIMYANTDGGMFSVILKMGELKSHIDFLRELEPRSGVQDGRYGYDSGKTAYKSQLTIAQRNAMIAECQAEINRLTDMLDEFNAKTSIAGTCKDGSDLATPLLIAAAYDAMIP